MTSDFQYKGYKGSAEYSATDDVFFGKLLSIPDLVTYESATKKGLQVEFEAAVEDYLLHQTNPTLSLP